MAGDGAAAGGTDRYAAGDQAAHPQACAAGDCDCSSAHGDQAAHPQACAAGDCDCSSAHGDRDPRDFKADGDVDAYIQASGEDAGASLS